jgi:hypothetical protein
MDRNLNPPELVWTDTTLDDFVPAPPDQIPARRERRTSSACREDHLARSDVAEGRLPLVNERLHAFLLVRGGEQRMHG